MNIKKYTIINILGEGAGGVAYLLSDKKGNKIVLKRYKGNRCPKLDDIFYNEIHIMKCLSGLPHFPKLLDYNETKYEIYMSYCGEKINRINAPLNWREQLKAILKLLKNKKIYHNSTAINNTCVKDGIIYFIDFAHSGKFLSRKRNLTKQIIDDAKDIYDAYDSNKLRETKSKLLKNCSQEEKERLLEISRHQRRLLIKQEKEYHKNNK